MKWFCNSFVYLFVIGSHTSSLYKSALEATSMIDFNSELWVPIFKNKKDLERLGAQEIKKWPRSEERSLPAHDRHIRLRIGS